MFNQTPFGAVKTPYERYVDQQSATGNAPDPLNVMGSAAPLNQLRGKVGAGGGGGGGKGGWKPDEQTMANQTGIVPQDQIDKRFLAGEQAVAPWASQHAHGAQRAGQQAGDAASSFLTNTLQGFM